MQIRTFVPDLQGMIKRRLLQTLHERLNQFPAIALLGPRQVGKTTLARTCAGQLTKGTIRPDYLDLENPADLAKLEDAGLYLRERGNRLLIIDEVQRLPRLFEILRGVIDERGLAGSGNGQFLLLGSASIDLLRQSSESLAGRIAFLELSPFDVLELESVGQSTLWVRGGFPRSVLAPDEEASATWRDSFITTYLERDIPQLGPRVPAETLRRFWTMLAHGQGGLLNTADLARSLAVDGRTVGRYLDLMVDLMLVRRLKPWHSNTGKRLVRSPKVYIRDTGLLHSLLRIDTLDQLLGHPIAGASWEGHVIENLLRVAPPRTEAYFYRTSAGAEIDLVLDFPGGRRWAIEVKRSSAPSVEKGFRNACEDIQPAKAFIVYPGEESYPKADGITAIGVREMATMVSAAKSRN